MQKVEINKRTNLTTENGPLANRQRVSTVAAYRQTVERVINEIRGKLGESLSLQEMAEIAYLSPFHFNRVFHQITGLPPTQFLYALRLDEAKRLLLTTNRSVTDVCFEVGYNSLGTFTTRFTQLVGVSPSRLRNMMDHMTPTAINSLLDVCGQEKRRVTSCNSRVSGRVITPFSFNGSIFVGLFQDVIPQGRPIAGALLIEPGNFQIGPVLDGRYYLFAATLPRSTDPLGYFLPEASSLLVGVGQSSVTVRKGHVSSFMEIAMRSPRITDPPILVALPSLLSK